LEVFLNGDFVDIREARVSAFDTGFLLGYGAFETMRAYAGKVFRPGAHLQRLNLTCTAIGIPFQGETHWLEKTAAELLARNGFSEARVRLTVTPGPQELQSSNPTVMIAAFPLQKTHNPTSGWRTSLYRGIISSRDPLRAHKTTSYLEKVLARQEAKKNGFDEALFVNEKGNVTEGAATNIFCVRAGRLLTPPVTEGLLPGITREVVAELAAGIGIPLVEHPLSAIDVVQSDEAFLTNSVVEIVPLLAVGNTPVADGKPGPITTDLQRAYRELVKRELKIY